MNATKKIFWVIACLNFCFGLFSVFADTSGVLMVTQVETNSLRKIIYYTSDSQKEVATVGYSFEYGADGANLVILETPHSHLKPGVHLLVIDRKNFNVIVDKNISGFKIRPLMLPIAAVLAVDSQQSLVYYSTFVGKGLGIVAVNWETGSVRELDPGTTEQTRGLSPVLSPTPNGFATEYYRMAKHSVVFLYNTTLDRTELKMANIESGANALVAVPGYGLVEYETGLSIYRLTDQSFSIALLDPPKVSNLKINTSMFARTVNGRPCLIWDDTKTGANSPLISDIIFFDPISGVVLSQVPINERASAAIKPDQTGDRIYLVNPDTGSIFFLDRQSGKVSRFAEADLHDFGGWGGSGFLDAN